MTTDDNQFTPSSENNGEVQIPKSRFDQALRAERERYARLEEENRTLRETTSRTPANDEVDVDKIADVLFPALMKRGILTREQQEAENNAKEYTSQLKSLQNKYDGNDGRPVFDPVEVAQYAQNTKIFDLEAAYEHKHKKELFDWELKQRDNGGNADVETEKQGAPINNDGSNQNLLSREEIAKKMAGPNGQEWWEKNREVYLKAAERGEIK